LYQLSSSHYRQNALYLKTRDVVTKVVTRCTKMNALLPSLKPVPGIIMLVLRAPGTYHKPTHWSCPHIANPYTGAAITSQTHTLELPTHRKSIHRSCHHITNPHTGAAHTSQIHTQELPSHHKPTHWSCPHITNPYTGAAITSQTHTLELPTHHKSIHRSCHHITTPHTGAAHTSQTHMQELPTSLTSARWTAAECTSFSWSGCSAR